MKNVILTGFMGTGKTSVGKRVAQLLDIPFRDIDSLIEGKVGLSITAIFDRFGETYFRDLETEVLEAVLQQKPAVVATGGGAVVSCRNRELMRQYGVVINLTAPGVEIEQRLASATDRPLLQDDRQEKILRMLQDREPYYAEADLRIDTIGKNIEDVALEVVRYLQGTFMWKN